MEIEYELDEEKIRQYKINALERIYKDEVMLNFIMENNISKTYVYDHIDLFVKALNDQKYCLLCPGLSKCSKCGTKLDLKYNKENGKLLLDVKMCKSKRQRMKIKDKFILLNIDSEDVFDYNLKDTLKIFKNERKNIVASMALKVKNDDFSKGLYLYGDEGVGKSFIMQVFAKTIAQKKDGYLIYIDAIDFTKELVGESHKRMESFKEDIELLSTIDYLFIDNFGMETVTDFTKDNITLQVLKNRKEKKLPTFFTSRYSPKELYNSYRTPKSGNFKSKDIVTLILENDVEELNSMKYPF